jgi:hypothetical protein
MNKIEIDLSKGINWPQSCAYCNGEPSTLAKTYFRVIDGYFFVAIRETTHTVHYPVCRKHRAAASFYGFMTNQSFPTGFVMVSLLVFLTCLSIEISDLFPRNIETIAEWLVSITIVFGVFFLKFKNPVKILKAKKNSAQIRIANQEYAENFRISNS